jgi:hypothetical protein
MRDDRDTERDMRRNEDPEKNTGAVASAAGAGFGGAVGFAALGPVGAVIGIIAGAAGGWWTGRGFYNSVADMDRADNEFHRAHEHAGATRPYEEVRHGYQLGYLAGRNPDHADRDFAAVEPELRAAWVKAHQHDEKPVSWDDVRAYALAGYELARQRA